MEIEGQRSEIQEIENRKRDDKCNRKRDDKCGRRKITESGNG